MKLLGILLMFFALSCGQFIPIDTPNTPDIPGNGYVIKATAYIPITVKDDGKIYYAASGSQAITISVAGSVKFEIDDTNFITPTTTDVDLLDFGDLEITKLRDNQLSVCGPGGTDKCTTASLLVYTTGTAGDGLYNATDGYGLPMYSDLTGTPALIGLELVNATVMQQYTIPANRRVVRLANFSPTPLYNITVDSSNAGVGSYSTTLVIEFALSN